MSLKGFHLFFITVSTVLSFALSAWSIMRFMDVEGLLHAALALLSAAGGILLIGYGIRIRKKLSQLGLSWDLQ